MRRNMQRTRRDLPHKTLGGLKRVIIISYIKERYYGRH